MLTLMRKWREKRARGDRGVAMVEMAIVTPFLALIVGGILEFGTMWRDDLTLSTSTRAAARVISNLGDEPRSDYEALTTLHAALATVDGLAIDGVLIYNASASDGAVPPTCFDVNGDPRGRPNLCNFYSEADLNSLPATCSPGCTDFPANADCSGGLTLYFCPQTDRETDQSTGTTYVGVWIRVQRDYYTGLFPGDGVTMTDRTVMKVEPQ